MDLTRREEDLGVNDPNVGEAILGIPPATPAPPMQPATPHAS